VTSPGLLQKNYFELFGLAPGFGVEPQALEASWKRLQAVVHPDRVAAQGLGSSRRLAVELSTRVNDAYQTLTSPLRRAVYLLELSGYPLESELSAKVPLVFLEQQMAWREQLDEAKLQGQQAHAQAVNVLRAQLLEQSNRICGQLAEHFNAFPVGEDAVNDVKQSIQSLMFLTRFEESLPQESSSQESLPH
jgi:molecular chaperone HscB